MAASSAHLPPRMAAAPSIAWRGTVPLCDIAVNLTDGMFRGLYRGKRKHEEDLQQVLARARDAGVSRMIVTGTYLEEAKEALALAREGDGLFCTCGVHPTRCNAFLDHLGGPDAYYDAIREVIRDGVSDGKVVAVGECGLDYDRTQFCAAETQKQFFERQFALADEFGLPMFLHNRNTGGDFVRMMREHASARTRGVVHSFTGSSEEAEELMGMGLFIGINGCSLKTEENVAVVRALPLDRILLETDAPWCGIRRTHAGHGHIKSTWPAVKPEKVLEVVAAIEGVDEETLAQQVWRNTSALFALGEA